MSWFILMIFHLLRKTCECSRRGEEVKMKRFGSFWFKSGTISSIVSDNSVLKTLVLVATQDLSNEEVLLNYRLSTWYT